MTRKWIQAAIKKPGALTRQAKAAGKTVREFEASPPPRASLTTRRRIALSKTLRKLRNK